MLPVFSVNSEPEEKVDLQASPVVLRTKKESQAPLFTKELEDTTAYFNKPLTLSCTVTGLPRPDIKWYRYVNQSRLNITSSDFELYSPPPLMPTDTAARVGGLTMKTVIDSFS